MPQKHRQRRKERERRILAMARGRGDKRPRLTILNEAELRNKIIDQMFREAHRDTERAEVVVPKGRSYTLVEIHEGEVLNQARRYVHPKLLLA